MSLLPCRCRSGYSATLRDCCPCSNQGQIALTCGSFRFWVDHGAREGWVQVCLEATPREIPDLNPFAGWKDERQGPLNPERPPRKLSHLRCRLQGSHLSRGTIPVHSFDPIGLPATHQVLPIKLEPCVSRKVYTRSQIVKHRSSHCGGEPG
jgi:hypothetical protein